MYTAVFLGSISSLFLIVVILLMASWVMVLMVVHSTASGVALTAGTLTLTAV